MMTALRLAIRFLLSRKSRTILSIIGISLGFALLFATNILMTSLEVANEGFAEEKYGRYEIIAGYQTASSFLTDEQVKDIQSYQEVSRTSSFLYPYIGDDHPYQSVTQLQPMYIGVDRVPLTSEHPLGKLSSGTLPGNREIAIPYSWAKSHHLSIGSELTLPFPPGKDRTVRVSGILAKSEHTNFIFLFERKWLADATGQSGHTTTVMLDLSDWREKEAVLRKLNEIDPDLYIDRQAAKDTERSQLGGLKPLVQGLGAAVTLGSTLLLISTLQMSIQERKKEIATLRLLGSKRRQIVWLVMTEATILALVSGLLGIGIGAGLAFMLQGFLARMSGLTITGLTFDPSFALLSLVGGMMVTVAGSCLPAVLASRERPLHAYREASIHGHKGGWVRNLLGAVAIAFALITALLSGGAKGHLASAVLLTIGTGLLLPALFSWTIRALSSLLAPLIRNGASLARRSTLRQARRSVQIAAVAMLACSIGIVGTGVLGTVKQDTMKSIMDRYPLDHILQSNTGLDQDGFSPELFHDIQELDGVSAVPIYKGELMITDGWKMHGTDMSTIDVDGKPELLTSLQPVDWKVLQQAFPLMISAEEIKMTDFNEGGVVITSFMSEKLGLLVGDSISMVRESSYDYGSGKWKKGYETVDLKVTGIIQAFPFGDREDFSFYTSPSWMEANMGPVSLDEIHYTLTNSSKKEEHEARIQTFVQNEGTSEAISLDKGEELELLQHQFLQRTTFLGITISLICLLALIGLMNNMTGSLKERRREIATMRALGISFRKISRLILTEGVLITSAGGILGSLYGTILLQLLLSALDHHSFVMSWAFTGGCLILSPFLGMAAVLFPLWQLRRSSILQELAAH
ncbi:FtsX-like permease family protein [Rossellomorea sp. RS05]|uniref:FtsX-like permease family protein n=1 Tax=Rossellomorea sp. RS05 TaxID=3149166 RepID=UPI003221531E